MTTPQTAETIHAPSLFVLIKQHETSLPLELTRVTAQLSGLLATVLVEQTFANPLEAPADLEYLFPLPHGASIVDFELRVGSRSIQGELQEIEQARQAYERAQAEGRRAGMLESRRPNLFAVRLANVMTGEKIKTFVRYTEQVGFDDGVCEFIFPMGITPRYTDPNHPEEGRGVQAPVAVVRQDVGTVEIRVSVDAGLEAGEPTSPSHPIDVVRLDERRFTVQLHGHQIPERDFLLRYAISKDSIGASALWTDNEGGACFAATLLPPALENFELTPQPRDFIFVLDRSGSMMGEPIAQARNALRACLRTLKPEDSFRILLFDDKLEWFQPEASRMSQEAVDAADRFLQSVQGRGGTDIISALEASLSLPEESNRTRFVVFLTDGAVAAEKRALQRVARQIANGRLFVFGIGPSVNRALLEKMAALGRGTAEFLQLNEDIEGAILRFQDRVSFPVVTDLALEVKNAQVWDMYPAHLPDLYIGQPLQVAGRIQLKGNTQIMLTGMQGNKPFRLPVSLPPQSANEPAVTRLWARSRIDDLTNRLLTGEMEDHAVRAEIISLALAHKLVTAYTAFVALDTEVVNPKGEAIPIMIAQPLPAGLSENGFGIDLISAAALPSAVPSPKGGFRALQMQAPAADQSEIHASFASYEAPARRRNSPSTRSVFDRQDQGKEIAEGLLRRLARTQNLDGSWNGSVEQTAVALLCFVRSGFTTRSGHFRRPLQKAAEWLAAAQASGFEAFARAVALAELARATGSQVEIKAAQQAENLLPPPASPVEEAAQALLDNQAPGVFIPSKAHPLDNLRMAGLAKKKISIEGVDPTDPLADTWLSLMALSS